MHFRWDLVVFLFNSAILNCKPRQDKFLFFQVVGKFIPIPTHKRWKVSSERN